jgi:hypothetical protein
MFGLVEIGMVGQVVCGGSKFLQRFSGVLEPSQLSMEYFRQPVVLVAILLHRSNFFVVRPSGYAMSNVCGGLIRGGYQICGLVAGCSAVVFCHGLRTAVGN